MSQTKKGSLMESLANVAVGYGIALASQILIFKYYGVHFSFHTNALMGVWFTVISITRSYCLRRAFNRMRKFNFGGRT